MSKKCWALNRFHLVGDIVSSCRYNIVQLGAMEEFGSWCCGHLKVPTNCGILPVFNRPCWSWNADNSKFGVTFHKCMSLIRKSNIKKFSFLELQHFCAEGTTIEIRACKLIRKLIVKVSIVLWHNWLQIESCQFYFRGGNPWSRYLVHQPNHSVL